MTKVSQSNYEFISGLHRVGVKWKELPSVTFSDQLEGKYIVSSSSLHVYLFPQTEV